MPKKGTKKKSAAKKPSAPAPQPAPEPQRSEAVEEEDEDAEEVKTGAGAKHAKDLDSVTDRVQDEMKTDSATMTKALSNLSGVTKSQVDEAELERRRAMAKIKLSADDVALIMNEFLMEESEAETVLRTNGGDVNATIKAVLEQ